MRKRLLEAIVSIDLAIEYDVETSWLDKDHTVRGGVRIFLIS